MLFRVILLGFFVVVRQRPRLYMRLWPKKILPTVGRRRIEQHVYLDAGGRRRQQGGAAVDEGEGEGMSASNHIFVLLFLMSKCT